MKTIQSFRLVEKSAFLVFAVAAWAGFFLLWGATSASAQGSLAELSAGMAIQGELNTQAVGPPATGALGIGRAQSIAGVGGAMAGTMPPPAYVPGVPPGGYAPGMPPPYPVDFSGAPPGFAPAPYVPPATVRALEGQRVYDAVSYRMNPSTPKILDDPQYKYITEEKKDMFSDDGRTLGDEVANDGIYSRVEPPSYDEYTGGFSHFYTRKTINLLRSAQELSVLDFFGLNVVTNERFSTVEKERGLVADRNNRIYLLDDSGNFQDCWAKRFLDIFRIEEGEPYSEFFPLYVPKPPVPPAVPPPAGWMPPQAIKTPMEVQLDRALELFREASARTMSPSELDRRIAQLRTRLLADETARNAFLQQYPAELPQPPQAGGGEYLQGGYYNVPMSVYGDDDEEY